MTPLWTAAEAARATGGEARGDWTATGVAIDSREIVAGDLFVALTAARDGHDFVADALAKGGAAALVSRMPPGCPNDAPLLIVEDVQRGLEALAAAARRRTAARVIGITGSAGKTSTKKMLADALRGQGNIHAAERSFNNHWGVPLTLARMPPETDYAVVEIGMSAPGEIAPLSRLAAPEVAVVTLVAAAHLEAFGSLEGIAHEKASIFEGLTRDGIAIYNADLETSPILAETAARLAARSLSFGASDGAEWRLRAAEPDADGVAVRLSGPKGTMGFTLGTTGRHFAMNALAVLAAIDAAGGDVTRAAAALEGWTPPGGRGQAGRIALADGRTARLVDDAFNANPASVAAALDLLGGLRPEPGGRRVVVLGDMLELGPEEARLHAEIACHPALAGVSVVHCVGPRMRHLWEALPDTKRGEWRETADAMRTEIAGLVDNGDIALIKGSKGSKVSLLVEELKASGTKPDDGQ